MTIATETKDAISIIGPLMNMPAPKCCGREMVMRFLNGGDITGEELNRLSDSDFAGYVLKNAILPPCWTCDECENEFPVEGLEWPEYQIPETPDAPKEPVRVQEAPNFCPHCGKKL